VLLFVTARCAVSDKMSVESRSTRTFGSRAVGLSKFLARLSLVVGLAAWRGLGKP
jgi:hypothetical protein